MAGVALWDALVRASGILTILLFSLFVSAAYEPGVNRFATGNKRSRGVVALLLLSGTLLFLGGLILIFGTLLYNQGDELVEAIPELTANIENTFNKNFKSNIDLSQYTESFRSGELEVKAVSLGGSLLGFIGSLLSTLFISYYLIVDGPKIRQRLCTLLPVRIQKEVLRMWDITVEKTGNYIFSRFLLGIFTFISHGVAFYVLGVPYAVPFALWAALVSQLIPVLGTYIAAGLPLLVVGAHGDGTLVLFMLLFVVAYQQLENIVISPKLLKKTMNLNPIVAFVGVLAAASTLNFIYVLLSLPIIATLQAFVTAYVQTHDLIDDDRFNPLS